MTMFDANDLILFVHIADAGSFTLAADRMQLPKSTLSRRLTTLEERLGEKLFVRSTRRLAITEFGERILEHARRLNEETVEVAALVQNRRATPQGELRVSMPADMTDFEFALFCTKFHAAYPNVHLRLDLSPQRIDLLGESYDIAIRPAPALPDNASLTSRRLFRMHQGLYASPGYLAAQGTPTRPEDLSGHHCLPLAIHDGQVPAWQLAHGAEQFEFAPKGAVLCNSPRFLRELALNDMGIANFQENHLVQSLVEAGDLVRVLPMWKMPMISVWCVMSGRRLLPSRTRIFLDMLRAHVAALPWLSIEDVL